MQGIELLKKHDILCKVNTVLIPGINSDHISALHGRISAAGVFIHNIMPLISAPEYGTHFGITGQRGPSPKELEDVRNRLPGGMRLMRHCRQCRADAVGMLGADRSAEFTLEKLSKAKHVDEAVLPVVVPLPFPLNEARAPRLRVAVATKNGREIDEHFGHAEVFQIYEIGPEGAVLTEERRTDEYCQGGFGDDAVLQSTVNLIHDCAAVFVMKVGHCPRKDMTDSGIEPVDSYAGKPIEASLMHFYLSKQLGNLSAAAG
jgi:nitrogen fixation protein NifB